MTADSLNSLMWCSIPLCDIPSGCCSFTGPWTVTRSSLRMLRRVAAFCRPLRPVLLLVSFPRSWSPAIGVLGLCWMWRDVPFACQRRPIPSLHPLPKQQQVLGPMWRVAPRNSIRDAMYTIVDAAGGLHPRPCIQNQKPSLSPPASLSVPTRVPPSGNPSSSACTRPCAPMPPLSSLSVGSTNHL